MHLGMSNRSAKLIHRLCTDLSTAVHVGSFRGMEGVRGAKTAFVVYAQKFINSKIV